MVGSNNKEQLAPRETAVRFHYDALDTLIGRNASDGKEQRFYRNDELATEVQGVASSSFVRAGGIVLAEHRLGAGIQSLLLAGNDKNSVLCEISQEAIRSIAYSPYGHRVAGSPVNSHLGYNGERREAQTGWYLLGNGYRVFNPLLMRFHSPDNLSPFGKGGLNAYMYCVGDPINNVDPTGHFFAKFLFGRRGAFSPPMPVAKMSGSLPSPEVLPPSFLRSKSGGTGSELVGVITRKHVKYLERRNMFYEVDFGRRQADYATALATSSAENKISPGFRFPSRKVSSSANSDRLAAHEFLGKPGITKTSERDFKIMSAAYKKGIATQSLEKQIRYFERLELGADEMKNIRGVDS